MNPIFLTTTIPYVNARPHVGFALELVQADFLARFYRLQGAPVRLQTGTDELAFKNVEAARLNGTSPQEWVDRYASYFQDLSVRLNISADAFIRTSSESHHRTARELIGRLKAEDLEKQSYRGLYCKGCEDFWQEKDLVEGCCPEHRTPPVQIEEENVFFKLSAYQSRLEDLITRDIIRVRPVERKKEILEFIRRGLKDISISRDAARSDGWGVSFPGAEGQVIYVWIDALANYLAEPEYWKPEIRKIHLLGKNVWKFHAVYWPALLLSAGLPLPDELVVHGFVTIDGKKISKSSGPLVDPGEVIDEWGADALRFYLLKEIPSFADGDFSRVRLQKCREESLANGLGNLAARLLTLAEKAGLEGIEASPGLPRASALLAVEECRWGDYLEVFVERIRGLNRQIEGQRPWEWLKKGEEGKLARACAAWLEELYQIAWWLQPVIPEGAARLCGWLESRPLKKEGVLYARG